MKALAALLILLAGAGIYTDAAAAEKAVPGLVENQRLCKSEDLAGGTWKMMQLTETPPRKEAAWYKGVPYHYLTFYSDKRYSYIASVQEIMTPQEVQQALEWPQKGNHVLNYTLDDKGVLNLYIDKQAKYSYRCLAIKATQGGLMKGDLVLTGYTQKARSELYKLYRRWF